MLFLVQRANSKLHYSIGSKTKYLPISADIRSRNLMMIFTFLPKHLVPYSPEKTEIMQEGDKRRNGDSYFWTNTFSIRTCLM